MTDHLLPLNCPLQLVNGCWTCYRCGWRYTRKGVPVRSEKPPRRNCPNSPDQTEARERPKGPGTELKKQFALFGIKETLGCKCNKRAAKMDRKGCDWCEENIETIVGWLEEEAAKRGVLVRGLPFKRVGARMLVKRAIRNARRAESEQPNKQTNKEPNDDD